MTSLLFIDDEDGRSMTEDLQPIEGGMPKERIEAARQHAANVARVAAAVKGKTLFAT